MKIIEGMKLVKDLQRKAADLREKVSAHCANLDFETPVYPDQAQQVAEWVQAHQDITKEILSLRFRIQQTNLLTYVSVELGGKTVTKSIAEWIHRRRDLAKLDAEMWGKLTDRGLREGNLPASTPGGVAKEVKIRRYYDPATRDKMLELYRSEPSTIDGTLEVVNAVTDLVD